MQYHEPRKDSQRAALTRLVRTDLAVSPCSSAFGPEQSEV